MTEQELIMLFKSHHGDKLELFKSISSLDRMTLITSLISQIEPVLNSKKNDIIFNKINYYTENSQLSTLLRNIIC